MDDRNSRLPVPLKARPPARRPDMTPNLWQDAAPLVARGAALVAISLVGEWLLRAATKRALTVPANNRKRASNQTAVVPKPDEELPEGTIAVTETYFMRRIIVRR
jgi:hypothetical protein